MTLLGGFNGLKKTIPRAEGVTMDEAGTLYMVSEPNLFYRFEKQKLTRSRRTCFLHCFSRPMAIKLQFRQA